jgi:hypothetical protein
MNKKDKDAIRKQTSVRALDGYRDRIHVSFGQKIQVHNFEPAEVSMGMSSDVQEDETVEDAVRRVSEVVEEFVAREVSALVKAKKNARKE